MARPLLAVFPIPARSRALRSLPLARSARQDDLMALVDEVWTPQQEFLVAGWDFGSALALQMARLHPGRVHALVVCGARFDEPRQEHVGKVPAELTSNEDGEAVFGEDWKWVKLLSSRTHLSIESRCKEMLQRADTRQFNR